MFKSLLIKISFYRKKYKSNVCIIKRKSLIEIFEGDVRRRCKGVVMFEGDVNQ